MAEVLATMAIGPLLSLVKEKASDYLLEKYRVMEGLEEQHKVLKRKLPAILDVIADAEMQASEHREGAKAWLQEVREVAYQGNDVFDEFKYEALRRKAKKEGHYRKLGMDVIKLFPTHNRVVFRYRMGNKLKLILQAIEVLIAEMNAFRFKFRPQQQLSMKWRQTDPEIIDPMKIASASRAKDMKEVVDTLLAQKSNVNLTVLPIVGMGGLGKTTLAQLVYNDSKIQEYFQLRIWVCVSDNFDVDFLATSIVQAANSGTAEVGNSPLDKLREQVSGKRYLLVLDDIWNRDVSKWERLKSYLQHGGMGSSVLTTTRDESIALFMGTTETCKLSLLDRNIIEKIINEKAFISKPRSPTNELLINMVPDMAERCAGSPLAATALGSLLRTKTNVEEWKAILSKSTICDDETGILPILKLSYNNLPSQMRQCFSFCAVFPKDYEIDVKMLVQLWMANGFILEEQGVCPEIRGKQIFDELASRSFFQDVKKVPFEPSNHYSKYGYCSIITTKIHDLMHDVAQSAMGKECVTIAAKSSKSMEPYSTRHLFVPLKYPKTVLNDFLEKSSPGLQTLLLNTQDIYDIPQRHTDDKVLQFVSKDNSIKALKFIEDSLFRLKPKNLHHLRYLDLSKCCIKALPEDISILYHLQTLNLCYCFKLTQLPRRMKYMAALRHLYTHGCHALKMMPPELRCLTSLRTLTYFVAGKPGSSCGGLTELGPLDDLAGRLELCQLENVTEIDAQAANLGNKKGLTYLRLSWSDTNSEVPQHDHNKVLEGLKPYEGIKVLKVYRYGGSTCPAWMNTLYHVVELELHECKKIEKLPALWRLPALQILDMSGIENLQYFCYGGDSPYTFKKLKVLKLDGMSNLETWWDINDVQGQQEPMFPELEKLTIDGCKKLAALPRASAVKESSSGAVNATVWRLACPVLKELRLVNLTAFHGWGAAEGTIGEQITTFPSLDKLKIEDCPCLSTLPVAPELNILKILGKCSQQIVLHAVARYVTSLSALKLNLWTLEEDDDRETTLPIDHSLTELLNDKEKWCRESSSALRGLQLHGGWGFLFPQPSAPAALLWNCFIQLEELEIWECDGLEHWPENVFQRLVSLRRLGIMYCRRLTTGHTQQGSSSKQPERSCVFPPCLESLHLIECDSLVEVPTPLPASLRYLGINGCDKLESFIVLRKDGDCGVGIRQERSAVIPNSSTAVPNLSPSTTTRLRIDLSKCSKLKSLSVQLDCSEYVHIFNCESLKSVDGDLSSLKRFTLMGCNSLESIPDGPPQTAYSSLSYLHIHNCPRLKVLPPSLKQRLNDIEETYLDARYTESRSWTWKRVMGRHR